MSLSSLPTEILQLVVHHLLWDIGGDDDGFRAVVRLRRVCKRFDAIAMYVWTKEIQRHVERGLRPGTFLVADAWQFRPSKRSFVARALLYMLRCGWNSSSWLVVTVRRTVDVILDMLRVDEPQAERPALEEKYILALGHAAAAAALEWDLVAQFGDGSTPGLELPRIYENALVAAAYLDDVALINLLLERGVDPDAETRLFGHPLHAAAMRGNLAATSLLLKKHSRLRWCYWKVTSPLHWAAGGGHVELLKLLLDQEDAHDHLSSCRREKIPPFSAFPACLDPARRSPESTNLAMFLRFPSSSVSTSPSPSPMPLVFPPAANLEPPWILPSGSNPHTPQDLAASAGQWEALKTLLSQGRLERPDLPRGLAVGTGN
ncbi:hypothetical protein VTO42DRAFT_2588 [Malbranchea cinnamomea]